MASVTTIKVEAGQDIVKVLHKMASEENMTYAFITGGRGMLTNATLIVGGANSGITNLSIAEPCRIERMNGKIERIKGQYDVNLRALFSRNGSKVGDGQVIRAESCGDFEIDLKKVDLGKIIIG